MPSPPPPPATAAHHRRSHPAPSQSAYIAVTLALHAFTALAFSRIAFPRFPHPPATRSCRPDAEGSWSAGVLLGTSWIPLTWFMWSQWGLSSDKGAAWPVANPVVTCADVEGSGFSSSFVANPFLFIQGDAIYMFFETKNPITSQGDIAAAVSKDSGVSWQQLGVVLDEKWHLSYPYVFNYENETYMMPESSWNENLQLYRATDFPLKWKLEKVLLEKPLVDSVIINFQDSYWLLGSELRTRRSLYLVQQLTPWPLDSTQKQNPIHSTDNRPSARNGGRPFIYNSNLYRVGKDNGGGSGHGIKVFKVEVLTTNKYMEVEVPFVLDKPLKGRNSWNGARSHHLDAQQLPSGQIWIGLMDGDRVPSDVCGALLQMCVSEGDRSGLEQRFNIDTEIKTRAVMELDDDIMMTCDDLERGFKVWREHPDWIVGYYPRLAEGSPLEYRNERYARREAGYNMILTGAAFMDHGLAFKSSTSTVDYVKPAWAIDMSKFSGVAISRNTQAHYHVRSICLAKFSEIYGNLTAKRFFNSRGDGWDV
ncbi:hypothetical protein PR202_gb11384 [Eleusine coracana subsp. coracana]|uniref:Glycosyl transferase 64 domain-containing protein n=1 Tax=Eleusine coracana subsp. coracana TaxID=191504 RepID=A0AAV5EK38_ELECO|nr:hypothetical protein PR202_gb11384 [Eleusine coracana subsp. coracana]